MAMRFAKAVYLIAGIWGFLVLTPMYFLQDQIAAVAPITHPEMFYGFVGTALVWQGAFLVIWRDPVRYRPLMPVTVFEKLVFGIPVLFLFAAGQVAGPVLFFGCADLVLGVLFATSFVLIRREARA
jgi:hypothetical protein